MSGRPPISPRFSAEEPDSGRRPAVRARRDSGPAPRSPEGAAWGLEHVHESERGELRIWLAAPTVMVLKYVGHSDAGYVDFIEWVFARAAAEQSTRLQIYIDCEEQTGYDAAFRDRIVEWTRRVQPDARCTLVRSRFVAFGVAVANALSGGGTTILTCRDTFRARLEISVRESLAAAAVRRPRPERCFACWREQLSCYRQ